MLSFHAKFVQTDRRTTVKQYATDLSIRGHKNDSQRTFFQNARKNGFFRTTVSIVYIMVTYIKSTCDQYGVDLSKMGLLPCRGTELHITKAVYCTDLFLGKIRQQV